MVNIVMRLLGLGSAIDALDGETSKAYIGGLGQMFSGAAMTLGGAGSLLAEILPLHGAAAYLEFAQHLKQDPAAAAVLLGAAMFSKGLADIGNRHATAKLANAIAAQAQAPDDKPEAAEQPSGKPAGAEPHP